MPSFKRRVPPPSPSGVETSSRQLPSGVKPAPYPSPVPHLSTGLTSLDDVLTGSGLPSSSLLVLSPALGLAQPANSQTDDYVNTKATFATRASGSDQTIEALEAAESAIHELHSYGVAQGLLSGHETVVAGPAAGRYLREHVPALAVSKGEEVKEAAMAETGKIGVKGAAATATAEVVDRGEAERSDIRDDDDTMKIAFRYAHRPKFKTTVSEPEAHTQGPASKNRLPEEFLYVAPFDMAKRWSDDELEKALQSKRGALRLWEYSQGYPEALCYLENEIERCKQLNEQDSELPPPVLRITILSLGSSTFWSQNDTCHEERLASASNFVLQLRRMIKSISSNSPRPIPCIATISLSSELLLPSKVGVENIQRIGKTSYSPSQMQSLVSRTAMHFARFVDSLLLLSDFSSSSMRHLAQAFPGYGGAIHLVKGPSIGSFLPSGESRSVLRGGMGEAGAENDVGWRRRKRGRGIVLETLHEDVDPEQTARENEEADEKKRQAMRAAALKKGDDIEEAAHGLARKSLPTQLTHQHHHDREEQKEEATPRDAKSPSKFKGLQSLRERGLAARKEHNTMNVEIEGNHSTVHGSRANEERKQSDEW